MGDASVRATYASSIKRIFTYCTSAEFTNATFEDVQVRANRLETVWKQFDEESTKILLNLTSEDEANEKVYAETEEMYVKAKVILTRKINESTTVTNPPAAFGAMNIGGASDMPREMTREMTRENLSVSFSNNLATGMHLAPERLPNFNGDYTEWPKFRDLYKRLVHENDSVIPMAKFNILEQHLKGEPLQLIAGYQRSDGNYPLAWEEVRKTYENPQLIVDSLLDTLNNLRALTEENPASLRYILSRYRAVTRQLSTAEVDVKTWDPLMKYSLAGLLDPKTLRDWEIHNAVAGTTTLEAMMNFLNDRVTGLLNLDRASQRRLQSVVVRPQQHTHRSHQQQQQQQNQYRRTRSGTPTVGLVAAAKREKLSTDLECPVCKENHEVPDCDKFKSLNCFPRMQRARSLRLCFGCLSPQHNLTNCDVPVCKHCNSNKRHHE